MHSRIRSWMTEHYSQPGADRSILYGGSVKPDNAAELIAAGDIDGFLVGDQFEVFSNGVSLGTTSLPGTGGTNTGMNFDAALADGIHSMGRFILGPGAYIISLNVLSRSGTDTANHLGAIRVDVGQVPLPAGGMLLLSALGLMAFRRHHRNA